MKYNIFRSIFSKNVSKDIKINFHLILFHFSQSIPHSHV